MERKQRALTKEPSLSKEECDLVVRLTYCGGVEAGMSDARLDELCKKTKIFFVSKNLTKPSSNEVLARMNI